MVGELILLSSRGVDMDLLSMVEVRTFAEWERATSPAVSTNAWMTARSKNKWCCRAFLLLLTPSKHGREVPSVNELPYYLLWMSGCIGAIRQSAFSILFVPVRPDLPFSYRIFYSNFLVFAYLVFACFYLRGRQRTIVFFLFSHWRASHENQSQ